MGLMFNLSSSKAVQGSLYLSSIHLDIGLSDDVNLVFFLFRLYLDSLVVHITEIIMLSILVTFSYQSLIAHIFKVAQSIYQAKKKH